MNNDNSDALQYALDVYLHQDGSLEIEVRVPAWRVGRAQYAVWCPFCGALHKHGRVENDGLHRNSHCAYVERSAYALDPVPGLHPARRPTILDDVARAARAAKRARRPAPHRSDASTPFPLSHWNDPRYRAMNDAHGTTTPQGVANIPPFTQGVYDRKGPNASE